MTGNPALFVNVLGFLTGAALYGMLVWMVLSHPVDHLASTRRWLASVAPGHRLALLTGLLGLTWNASALLTYALPNLGWLERSAVVAAAGFSALGFLPAVVVHTLLAAPGSVASTRGRRAMTVVAYGLSSAAAVLHLESAVVRSLAPSPGALILLTVGFTLLATGLLTLLRRQAIGQRAIWVVALAIFAVSALHLLSHDGSDPWWVEVLGEHASVPLAAAILAQDYRFALADIFIKRAVGLFLLLGVALGLYFGVLRNEWRVDTLSGDISAGTTSLLLLLWVATALAYPSIRRAATWVVDTLMLRRADSDSLSRELIALMSVHETPRALLDAVSARLATALSATEVRWQEWLGPPPSDPRHMVHVGSAARGWVGARVSATVFVPTTDAPQFQLVLGELAGGRRLLSGDLALLESTALFLARRLDALRVSRERFERSLREEHMAKLATEAELRALRARLNPHFLFNALTTVGYLIEAAPTRALGTLMRLTELLRAVLTRSSHEFVTLGDEMDLVAAYLEVEQARFEERLRVSLDVPSELRSLRIPTLLVQPIVENAIKHGIAPHGDGGDLGVSCRLSVLTVDGQRTHELVISVRDTGRGFDPGGGSVAGLGVGLASVEQRLRSHYGDLGRLVIASADGKGSLVEVHLPAIVAVGDDGADQSSESGEYRQPSEQGRRAHPDALPVREAAS